VTGEPLTTLWLSGYVPLKADGYALPCYSTGPQSNRWYCAVCTIDGDHRAYIASFEPYDAEGVLLLPAGREHPVAAGDPWHDVLLWNGQVYVGTADDLAEQLSPHMSDMAGSAPLTLLDVLMASEAPDLRARQEAAFEHVRRNWGLDVAGRWQSDMFARHQLIIEIRRIVAATGAATGAGAEIVRLLEVDRTEGGRIRVRLPCPLQDLLGQHGLADFQAAATAFSDATGIDLEPLSLNTGLPEPASRTIATEEDPTTVQNNEPGERVLVILSGVRARALGRHLRAPDWRAVWEGEPDKGAVDAATGLTVLQDPGKLPALGTFGALIWVADDEVLGGNRAARIADQIRKEAAGEDRLVLLLAPTLPAQRPPELLAREQRTPFALFFDAIIDTSAVRSPFWSGNPKRSIDRRVADLVSAAAAVCSGGSPLARALSEGRDLRQPLLLSLEVGSRRSGQLGLASEVSAAGFDGRDKISGATRRFFWTMVPDTRLAPGSDCGAAELGHQQPDFPLFANAAVRAMSLPYGVGEAFRVPKAEAASALSTLRFPHLSAAFKAEPGGVPRHLLVTAEAPSMKAVREAAREGWTILRYSDVSTARDLPRRQPPVLPDEVAMPRPVRLARNRALAVRGVDPRDVVRLSAQAFEAWRSETGPSELKEAYRWYRSSLEHSIRGFRDTGTIALPLLAIREAELNGDRAVSDLRAHVDLSPGRPDAQPKRSSDLRASWSRPLAGSRRFVLEDGRLPVRLAPLHGNEVVAQKFFTIDGDGAVPALFLSRLFRVWAGATLTRSPSWTSRFSVTRTFETFPIPEQFTIVSDAGAGRASLTSGHVPPDLRKLIDGLEEEFRLSEGLRLDGEGRAAADEPPGVRDQIDASLLHMIGLEQETDDLAILERLVEMNRSGAS
jgi:hypothetical protein